jgi:hypothetical protein
VRSSIWRVLAVGCVSLTVSVCASAEDETDDPTDPGGTGEFFMRANVDGAWGAESVYAGSTSVGTYSIGGTKTGGSNPYILTLSLHNIGGPGTYPLGTGSTVAGGSGVVAISTGTATWITPLSGADGSLTITALTTTRIAGTFSFAATPIGGGATGTKTVSGGEFSVQLTPATSGTPLPENYGSRVSATIAGAPWNAAFASGTHFAPNRVATVQAHNNARTFSISLNEVTGPGTFALGGARVMSVAASTNTSSNSWHSSASGSSGSVTITSLTTTRMRGTFTATLGPTPGTTTAGTIVITNGSFDIGLGAPPG